MPRNPPPPNYSEPQDFWGYFEPNSFRPGAGVDHTHPNAPPNPFGFGAGAWGPGSWGPMWASHAAHLANTFGHGPWEQPADGHGNHNHRGPWGRHRGGVGVGDNTDPEDEGGAPQQQQQHDDEDRYEEVEHDVEMEEGAADVAGVHEKEGSPSTMRDSPNEPEKKPEEDDNAAGNAGPSAAAPPPYGCHGRSRSRHHRHHPCHGHPRGGPFGFGFGRGCRAGRRGGFNMSAGGPFGGFNMSAGGPYGGFNLGVGGPGRLHHPPCPPHHHHRGHHSGSPSPHPPAPPFNFGSMLEALASHPIAVAARDYFANAATAGRNNKDNNGSNDADAAGEYGDGDDDGLQSFVPPIDIFEFRDPFNDANNDKRNPEKVPTGPSGWVIHVAIPGAKKEDVGVDWEADKGNLVVSGIIHRPGDEAFLSGLVSGERKVGLFRRAVTLPPPQGAQGGKDQVDANGITARLEDGVLIVTVPCVEREWTEVRKVDVM